MPDPIEPYPLEETAEGPAEAPRAEPEPRGGGPSPPNPGPRRAGTRGLTGLRWLLACGLVFALVLAAAVPTTGDIGLTWDEPAYRYSQMFSVQWWQRWQKVKTWSDVQALLAPDVLLYYWPYGRFGVNFHPPLAGQLNLLTHTLFGTWMKDIPARRMSSVIEFAATITILFGFLARRYGAWVGAIAAGSLLLMPRLYGDAHIAGTDTPGLFLWAAATVAFWKGLYEPHAKGWRVLVGILLGLAFVEKMGAVIVIVPLLAWLVLARLSQARSRADWIDGLITSGAMLIPLGIAYLEVKRLAGAFIAMQISYGVPPQAVSPSRTNLFTDHPPTRLWGVFLLAPLVIWLCRRVAGKLWKNHPIWGQERPALEIWTAILAFAPALGWLGNPAWWRETFPRLAHYYAISTARRGVLPDIQILYFGQSYEYSLPWHNAWVLIAITVPAAILVAAAVGLVWSLLGLRRDRLPWYFLVHLLALPVIRMLPTPAHDGVRLFLPTFFFVAAFAGWGAVAMGDVLTWVSRARRWMSQSLVAALVLGSAAWQLCWIHPYELSYYNELIGGPAGAWRSGFELSYWYDAFNDQTLAEINAKLPPDAAVAFSNDQSAPIMLFQDLQSLGKLRGDIVLGAPRSDTFPFMWLLTHDSKASAFSRLLFAIWPYYALTPRQLDGLRVLSICSPEGISRAWTLHLLLDAPDTQEPERAAVPEWVRSYAPALGRLWGEGVTKSHRLSVNEPAFEWARTDPEGLRRAARALAQGKAMDPDANRLKAILTRYEDPAQQGRQFFDRLMRARPRAIVEAVEILIARPDSLRTVLQRYPYTDPATIGGYLDREFVQTQTDRTTK